MDSYRILRTSCSTASHAKRSEPSGQSFHEGRSTRNLNHPIEEVLFDHSMHACRIELRP